MTYRYKFGLLGHNIDYSKSADIFDAIFSLKKIKGLFETYNLEPSSFESAFREIITNGIDGLSVTIPYKKKVIPLLDEIDPIAEALEAVNSIAVSKGRFHGYNTDIYGFAFPLKPHENNLKKGRALILGCGGSARAVIYSLHTDFEISHFTVLGRSEEKLAQFQISLNQILLNSELLTDTFNNFPNHTSGSFSIIVNCTPLGGWNQLDRSPIPAGLNWSDSKIYYDLNYNDGNNIVSMAKENGLTVFDGSTMLVGQAIRSFEIWSGETVGFDEVYETVFAGRTGKSIKAR